MLSDKLPSPLSAPLPHFLPVSVSLLHHAPIRIKVVQESHPAGSKEQGLEDLKDLSQDLPCSFEPETPVRFCEPRKSSVPGRVQSRSTFMVGCQHCMAHGVVSKERGLGSVGGVERLTNQLAWLFQQKLGFPVPAQTDYRNILSSLNST